MVGEHEHVSHSFGEVFSSVESLEMAAEDSSEMSVNTYQIIRRRILLQRTTEQCFSAYMKLNFLIRKMVVADVSEMLVYIYHMKRSRLRKLLNQMINMLKNTGTSATPVSELQAARLS